VSSSSLVYIGKQKIGQELEIHKHRNTNTHENNFYGNRIPTVKIDKKRTETIFR
jgi:hypothetical protein